MPSRLSTFWHTYRGMCVAIALVIVLLAVVLSFAPGVANTPFIYQRF